MAELFTLRPGASLATDFCLQSSLILLTGLAVSVAVGKRPSRAHLVLVLAAAAALVTPLCSQLVHRAGWGIGITSASATHPPLTTSAQAAYATRPTQTTADSRDLTNIARMEAQVSAASPKLGKGPGPRAQDESRGSQRLDPSASVPARLKSAAMSVWCVLSGVCLVRLIVSIVSGRRAVRQATPIKCEAIEHAALAACRLLSVRVRPDLRLSSRVTCPAIWCWGTRPVIVLPQSHEPDTLVDWIGVFCHELAHWLRRDHVSSLLAEVLVCVVPWHPLAWVTRHRLRQQSELACDEWAIASGQEPAAYAETLLTLASRRRTLSALAAVSRQSGLSGRIAHLVALIGPVEPRPGRRWSGAASLAAVGLITLVALAQSREGRARSDDREQPSAAGNPASPSTSTGHVFVHRALRGFVRDATGKPVTDASIFAVGRLEYREPPNGWYFTHHGEKRQTLAQVSSDRDGKFVLDLDLDSAVLIVDLIARSPGMGLTARTLSVRPDDDGQMLFEPLDDRPVELTLLPNLPIEGRLLSAIGKPIAGVLVSLSSASIGEGPIRGGFALHAPLDGEGQALRTPYWPEPVNTDAQGRFRLDGASQKSVAQIVVKHDDFIHEQLVVSTEPELTGHRLGWRTKPVSPRFTHVLESSRPIEGIVTDEQTGQPLAGVHVEVGATGSFYQHHFPATTDAQGRYRVVGVAWNSSMGVHVQMIPGPMSGYVWAQDHRKEWPVGATELRWNLSLTKGRFARGKVIDGDSKRPIAGALVSGESVNQTALTDEHGNFVLCIDPDSRSLFIEAPTPNYRRLTVEHGRSESMEGTFHPHGYARIKVNPDGTIAPIEVTLKKGATVAAQAVDPEGMPLRGVWVCGQSLFARRQDSWVDSGRCSLGLFRAASFEPGRSYRIFFFHDEPPLAGFADLTAKLEPSDPVNVTLRATARVRGKLRNPDGTPSRRQIVSAYFPLTFAEAKLEPMDFLRGARLVSYSSATRRGYLGRPHTNDEGDFEIGSLIAGARTYLAFGPAASDEIHYIVVDPLEPGEDRDLGAIKPHLLIEQQP
jgi:beta-lactamase regulating signal transducer with metallopeptidase domain